jgi:hypothetical protein
MLSDVNLRVCNVCLWSGFATYSALINLFICNSYLGKDKRKWEDEVFKFARLHQLRAISCYLPRGDNALDPHIYEMVLYEYLKMEPQVIRLC